MMVKKKANWMQH